MRDTNKRPRVASTGELKTHKKKTEGEKGPSPAKGDVKEEDIQSDRDITTEIAAIAVKNEQLQESVASLKHRFSLRGEETHQLLLGLGALNAVANELETLQKDYQERSTKNAALVQESLTQISNCSAQVNTLKRCRGLTATQLQNFRHECAQEMTRLVNRLGDLADSTCQEPDPFDGDDVSCAAVQINNNRLQVERLKEEVCEYRTQFIQGELVASVPSLKSTVSPMKQETTQRINLALAQLDELHAEMFQLKQALMQENQSYRRHLENLVSRQMAHIREVQDNETERIHEEMDEISDKRKRKRLHKTKSMAASSSSVSSVDAQLKTLENWHRALTIDIRELRREGARVRHELEKLDDTVEAAVEKAEQCKGSAKAASKAKDEAVRETQKKLQTAETRHNTELEKLNKRLGLMDKKLERYRQSSINEEFLMTQLTELQEQYENELTKVREDRDATLETQQKQLQKMERVMMKMQEEQKKQTETMERMWREENSRLSLKIKQMATRQEMYSLQQQMETMERDNHDEQG
ncbi:Hypothetical protein PHPALM_9832, partial [Phytophthora palmivora]